MSADSNHPTVIVVGGSRGIGLDLARRLIDAHPKHGEVVATMRKPNPDLLPKEAQIDELDMTKEESVKECASHYKSVVRSASRIIGARAAACERLT